MGDACGEMIASFLMAIREKGILDEPAIKIGKEKNLHENILLEIICN